VTDDFKKTLNYIVVANFKWGRGSTVEDAAWKAGFRLKTLLDYVKMGEGTIYVYDGPLNDDAYIDKLGMIYFPEETTFYSALEFLGRSDSDDDE
jgi:hypothetical protein